MGLGKPRAITTWPADGVRVERSDHCTRLPLTSPGSESVQGARSAQPLRRRSPRLVPELLLHSDERLGSGAGRARCSAATTTAPESGRPRSEEHTSELQSRLHLVCRLLLEKK